MPCSKALTGRRRHICSYIRSIIARPSTLQNPDQGIPQQLYKNTNILPKQQGKSSYVSYCMLVYTEYSEYIF